MSLISRDSRKKRAFTLLEVLVGLILTGLLFTLAYQFLIPALKISNRVTRRAESQQRAILALRSIVSEMERSNLFGVSFASDSSALAIHQVADVTQNSERVFEDHLVVYQYDAGAGKIHRFRWKSPTAPSLESPRQLDAAELIGVDANREGPKRLLVQGVQEFEVSHSGADPHFVTLPLVLRLKMKTSEEDGVRDFDLIRTVSFRNQE